jgi:hypothetical protein
MKKFLAIAMIAATLTSCGGGEKTEGTPETDTTTTAAPVETPVVTEDTTTKVEDTTKKAEATATPEVKAEEKK